MSNQTIEKTLNSFEAKSNSGVGFRIETAFENSAAWETGKN